MTKYYGWVASGLSILMYAANFDQARLNLMGQKGSLVLPIFTLVAAFSRCMYAERKANSPITRPNVVGIIASLASIVTYFI